MKEKARVSIPWSSDKKRDHIGFIRTKREYPVVKPDVGQYEVVPVGVLLYPRGAEPTNLGPRHVEIFKNGCKAVPGSLAGFAVLSLSGSVRTGPVFSTVQEKTPRWVQPQEFSERWKAAAWNEALPSSKV